MRPGAIGYALACKRCAAGRERTRWRVLKMGFNMMGKPRRPVAVPMRAFHFLHQVMVSCIRACCAVDMAGVP